MTYVDEEFRPFIRNMFDEIVAASRADTLANLLMRKLDLNESDRPIIEQSIEQLSRGPFDYPLLSAVRHNPFSRLRKYEWCFIPSNVCDRKDQMQRTLNSITCLRAAIDKIMEFVDPEFEPFIENTFGEVLADDLITDLDLSDSDQPRLESIVGNPSATHLAELMGILDEAEFPDYSYDPGERCPLASYLPTAQAFHRAAKSPLVQRLLVGDFQWVAFTKRSFRLAHRAMELQARLEQLSSQCNDTSRDLQNRKGINTRPFIETLQAIASETTRVQQALNERYAQLSRIIPER
ncbi:MAG: hypothetical protein LVR00_02320 [Rhabdochlamydiaceae bacterium]